MILSVIVAMNRNRGIGFENSLLYRMPNDMKHFKALTTGHTVVMGRKTFESLPKGALPNRRNIVLTRREGVSFEGTEVFHSLDEALKSCGAEETVFIIGGETVYREAMPLADRLHITEIDDDRAAADAFFPEIDLDVWKEKSREAHPADEKHLCSYSFVDYSRK